jgi:hypothetical protein
MRNAKQMAVVAGGMFAVLALGACGNNTSATTGSGPAPTATSSAPSPISSASPSATATSTSTSTSSGASPRCHTSDLKVTDAADEGGGSAGHHTEILLFQNTSDHECRMQGYPGVSFVTGDSGKQVGSAFTRTGSATPATVLLPGGHAHALIQIASEGTTPAASCAPVDVRGYRIYPPDETASIYVPKPQIACSATGKGVGQVQPVLTGASGG